MIWLSMISYFYIINITKVPHKILSGLINGLYYIYYKASYVTEQDKGIYIKKGVLPVLNSLNIKIKTHGFIDNKSPTLYISNHNSHLDSLILKYLKPEVKTISKDDAAGDFSIVKNFAKTILDNWGVILYKRGSKKSGQEVRNLIKTNILNGKSVLVYPEGGSFAFNGFEKFYPGSFEVAYENNLNIQPVTIRYMTDITWGREEKFTKEHHINMITNARHCQNFKENIVNVTFHPVINSSHFDDASHLLNYVKFVITDEWINQHNYDIKNQN